MRQLYFGDNLGILRDDIEAESVDLIYLDPPFNSKREYSVLFKSSSGKESHAQVEAFEDSWHWGPQALAEYEAIMSQQMNADLKTLLSALRSSLRQSDMMAYLVMMSHRLLYLHRVLKPQGSLYLHCDPAASHYIKLVLDSVFGPKFFRNEIIWKRTTSHNNAKRWGPIHDTILFYTKSAKYTWNKTRDTMLSEVNERPDITGDGIRHGDSGKDWRGFNPTSVGRHWAPPSELVKHVTGREPSTMTSQEKLDALDEAKLIWWPKKEGGRPRYILPADMRGKTIQDIVLDIPPLGAHAAERLGYDTQKPQALLERIISASSNPGDIILDPFCGCGTTIEAAESLDRQWVGIDVTHLAITHIEKRMREGYPGIEIEIEGSPTDYSGAKNLAERGMRYEFEYWACSLVQATPKRSRVKGKKGTGPDKGIDGEIIVTSIDKDHKILVSIKSGKPNVQHVRELIAVVQRENADYGLLIELEDPTSEMKKEAVAVGYSDFKFSDGTQAEKIQILTIKGLLDGVQSPIYPNSTRRRLKNTVGKVSQPKKTQITLEF